MATQRERKIKLKKEAENRLKAYNNMSLKKKLELIRSRRGKSKKEETRILKLIEGEKQ